MSAVWLSSCRAAAHCSYLLCPQSYTKCLPEQNQHSVHVKSIVNTEHYARVDG